MELEEGVVGGDGDGGDAEEEGEEDEDGVDDCGWRLGSVMSLSFSDVGGSVPVKGPLESKSVFATVSIVKVLFSAARVTMAAARRRMPPMIKSASKPMKA